MRLTTVNKKRIHQQILEDQNNFQGNVHLLRVKLNGHLFVKVIIFWGQIYHFYRSIITLGWPLHFIKSTRKILTWFRPPPPTPDSIQGPWSKGWGICSKELQEQFRQLGKWQKHADRQYNFVQCVFFLISAKLVWCFSQIRLESW